MGGENKTENIDKLFVYLGSMTIEDYNSILETLMQIVPPKKIVVAACDCGKRAKKQFAEEHGLEITIHNICGGRDQLYEIASEIVREEK